MKMIILGAGASYDSVYQIYDGKTESEWRPPLGNQLFEPRKNFRKIFEKYDGLKGLFSSLNSVNDIEDYFQKNWDFAIRFDAKELLGSLISVQYTLQELMIQISENYRDIGLSNYDILVEEAYKYAIATKEDIIFVTFNYDLLLEYSFKKIFPLEYGYLSVNDYLRFPLKIIKLHGSCNWFRAFKAGFPPTSNHPIYNQLYRIKPSIDKIEDYLEQETTISSTCYSVQGGYSTALFPQLLIPFKSKDSFILPQKHKEYLETNISKITSILIVGWKGQEEHFLNLLKEAINEEPVTIESVNCGDRNIEVVMKQFLPNSIFYHFEEGFRISKYNKRSIYLTEDEPEESFQYSDGSFSSYCQHLVKNKRSNFF